MHTSNDVKTFLFKYIKDSGLYYRTNIYKSERPLNSTAKDVVINVPSLHLGVYGKAIAYINIFVPDIRFQTHFIEDTKATAIAERDMIKLFENYKCCTDEYRVKLENVCVLKNNGANEHFVSIELSIDIVNF